MLNASAMSQELVRAFNINLCYNNIAFTNLIVQNLDGKDHIISSFNENTKHAQRVKYLSTLKERVIKTFYQSERAAGISYNLQSFPLNFNKGRLEKNDKGKRFLVEIDKDVTFNLKSYLAHALAKDIKEKMGKEFGIKHCMDNATAVSFNKDDYLCGTRFYDKELKEYFINSFSADIEEYDNAPNNYLEVRGNDVYIKKGIFDNIEFIKDIAAHNASLICRDLEVSIKEDRRLESLKFPIVDFIRRIGIPVDFIFHTSYSGSNENSILVPITKGINSYRFLTRKEANIINGVVGMAVLNNVEDYTSPKHLSMFDNKGMYGIDFSDLDISYCMMNTIMENSVINKYGKLEIDPGLHLRALSPDLGPDGKGGGSSKPDWRTRVSPRQGSGKEGGMLFDTVGSGGNEQGDLPESMDFPTDEARTYESEQPLSKLNFPDASGGPRRSLSAAVVGADKKDLIRAWNAVARFNANTPPYREQQSPPPPPISPTHESKQKDSGKDSWGKKISGVFSGLLRRGSSSPPSSKEASPTHDPGRQPPLPPRRTTTAWQAQSPKLELRKPGDRGSVDSKNNSSGRGSASSSFLDLSGSHPNLPGDRGSVDSGNNSEVYDDEYHDSVPLSFNNTAGPSGQGVFPRNNETYASFMSNSSTSSGTSTETVIKSSAVMSRHNREHGPSLLYNETAGLAKRLGLEPPFEDYKYRLPRSRPERNNSPPPLQMSSIQVEQPKQQQTHAQREILRAKRLTGRGVVETSGG